MITERKGSIFTMSLPKNWEQITIEYLLQNIWKAPKKIIHQYRMEKAITVNGSLVSWKNELTSGDTISIDLFKKEAFGFIPTFQLINVLYEDDHLLVINKPSGIDTHPNEPQQNNTLANGVAYHLLQKGEQCRAYPIHRLDRDTSGSIIFAKHALSQAILDRHLRERKIKRTYLALVHGNLQKIKGTIQKNIGKDRHHPTRRRVSVNGQTAITHYQKSKYIPNKNLSLVEISLETGRTHQIRVHMSDLGHPLAGDTLYGGSAIFSHQALHAKKISFQHPLTLESIECEADFSSKEIWGMVDDTQR
ncbi:RluA family pseudouridine synthase [Bacillus sp. 2205SS5-2]|uniref:RluA family pseudouridine synthase n=1 Tax=Bacillus sp. 2205SS5-2 TaxID=3109031 RepID=UPI0030077D30